ncbi:TonB-dependent receptor [Bowmanella yangjiangensis]|uniref:TonB-dependent receptor n=1 Tax=Bowmanella yangjiangensis TaxID=2811230 RepID=A0ABS3CUY1_9ALTE|nr:TonB-dependent receptor [Bowmanella yangjiangensis]MBN7820120.1 TonB-dependent receptor [Bowmanella yangjiangensis]
MQVTASSILVLSLLAGMVSQQGHAADNQLNTDLFSLSLDELLDIKVEARKVLEDLQLTPLAVSALTGQQLLLGGHNSLLDASYFLPNIDVTTVGENSGCTHCANITIRGVGQVDPIPTIDPSVGIYVDGVYQARSAGGIVRFLDIDHLEVLRGPQGTLFGKNTIGGAVQVFTNKVGKQQSLSVKADMGEYQRRDIALVWNQPLAQDSGLRLALSKNSRDGFVTRLNGEQEGGQDDFNLLAKYQLILADALDLTLSYSGQWQQNGSAPAVIEVKNDEASLIRLFNQAASVSGRFMPLQPLQTSQTGFDSAATLGNDNSLSQYAWAATINWQISPLLNLKSITAYNSMNGVYSRDFDHNPVNIGVTRDWQGSNQRSQEFNLTGQNGSLDWLLGLFAFDEDVAYQADFIFFENLYAALEALPGPLDGSPLNQPTDIGGPGNPLNISLDLDNRYINWLNNQSYALFAQTNWQLDSQWSLTLGGRLTYERKSQQVLGVANVSRVELFRRTAQDPQGAIKKSWRVFSPLVALQYQYRPSMMLYGSASKGFKSGGFNGLPNSPVTAQPFDPEYLTSYELGMRSQWLDNKLRLNLTGFYINHQDMQLRGGQSSEESGLEILIDNVGEARSKGVELEWQAKVNTRLGLSGSLSYIDAEFVDVGSATQVTLDSKLIRTPAWTSNLALWYRLPLAGQSSVTARLDWAFRSKTYNDVFNSALAVQKAFSLVNARLNWELNERWSAAAFVTNLTDTQYVIGANDFTQAFGVAERYLAAPRQWGISLTYQF